MGQVMYRLVISDTVVTIIVHLVVDPLRWYFLKQLLRPYSKREDFFLKISSSSILIEFLRIGIDYLM
jgi:hypothetical protein